jgi:TPR repeat protein
MRQFVSVLSIAMFCSTTVQAQDCKDGLAAYVAGNYSKAAVIFQPLAAQGDDCAQYQLGEMYKLGQGVPQDKAKALELFKQAAARGNDKAKLQAAFLEK